MLGIVKYFIINPLLDSLHIRRRPRVIQLPITSRCNSRCATCNVWKHKDNIDINPEVLANAFKQPFFNKVNAVGINGGELTLVKTFPEIIDAVFTLPSLRSIYIISNGLLPDKLLETLKWVKAKAAVRNIKVSMHLSVDGYGRVHEDVRGIPNCWQKTNRLIQIFANDITPYCDVFSVGCTISQKNISYLNELDEYLKPLNIDVLYHLAVPNKRIHTYDDSESYYVLADERSRLLAMEFFYDKMSKISLRHNFTSAFLKKFQYFSSFYFLKHRGKGRLSSCAYKYQDITIDENLNAYYCATASDSFGNLTTSSISEALTSEEATTALRNVKKCCSSCIHYIGIPTPAGLMKFVSYLISERYKTKKFKVLCK